MNHFLIFAYFSMFAAPAPCRMDKLAVARAAEEVFLDPTSEKRAGVTRTLIASVIRPLERPGAFPNRERENCEEEVFSAIWSVGDRSLLDDAFSEYRQAMGNQELSSNPQGERVWGSSLADFVLRGRPERPRISTPPIPGASSLLDSDPRRWDPHDVALLSRALLQNPPSGTVPVVIVYRQISPGAVINFDTHRESGRMLEKFAPMGFHSAFEITGLDATTIFESPVDSSLTHFAFERYLYDEEWADANPDKSIDSAPAAERQKLWNDRQAYANTRWRLNDRRAPHPDLDLVRKELHELQSDQ